MVEAVANSVEDYLIDGLSFKLRPGASYVTNRRQVTFHPSGSNIYKTNSGTKVLKIQLNGDQWLDPSTVRLMFTLNNDDADLVKALRPISGPWAFWRRLRVMCGGALVEDFEYNRTHEMLHIMESEDKRKNDMVECACGTHLDFVPGTLDSSNMLGFGGGKKRTFSMKLMSGLFNQKKYLPLRFCPITLELELVNSAYDPIVVPTVGIGSLNSANTSESWSITDCQVKCDVVALDNQLENSYYEHLLAGNALPIEYDSYITQSQASSGQDISVNVSRSITRLKSAFITFNHANNGKRLGERKDWNNFYHPMVYRNVYDDDYELEWQVQLGSKLYPEYPCRSLAESWAKLKQCVYGINSPYHSMSITADQYREGHFVAGVDFERVNEAGFTGTNTKDGQLLNLRVKAQNKAELPANEMPESVHMVLHHNAIAEIRDSGVAVFD
jgi:hypothetical protein